ncbi:MAG: DUF2537 domain-containing protein, partial [Pseudonocardiaceae bacterium]
WNTSGPTWDVSVGPDGFPASGCWPGAYRGHGVAFTIIGVDRGGTGLHPGESTPWATGLTVSVVAAAIMVIALLSLSQGLAPNGTGVVVLTNLLVAAGLAPSLWLGRATPIWRWVAYGTVAGIVATWIALLLSLLG